MTFKKKKSIVKKIKIRFFLLFIFVVIGFIAMYGLSNINKYYYDKFVYINSVGSSLPVEIDYYDKAIQSYVREWDDFYIDEYKKHNIETDKLIDILGKNIPKNDKLLEYLRVITNMHSYQKKHVAVIEKNKKITPKLYKKISFLQLQIGNLNRQAQLMALNLFDVTNKEYNKINTEIKHLERIIIIGIILFSLIIIINTLKSIQNFFRIINDLVKVSEELSHGNWDIPEIKENRYFEFDIIGDAFNKMKKAILQQMEELKEKSIIEIELHKEKLIIEQKNRLLKEAKLKALQMQMNPHFLFNTLNMIGRTAMMSNIKLTSKLIESVGQILRFNLENEENLILLEKELDLLDKYIFIQKTRFGKRVEFNIINNCSNIYNLMIPPMMLQPIVENSILHGMRDITEKGIISITIEKIENKIKITIFDNGKGMKPDILAKIIKRKENHQSKKSIGIQNVVDRLEVFYNRKDLFFIKSEVNMGTEITLFFPILTNS